MKIVTEVSAWQAIRKQLTDKTIGFVHTMGNLHAGHLSLCERARAENDIVVAAIFINPTQFNQQRDFDLYPRTLAQDQALLEANGVDYVLLFKADELYADGYQVQVSETALSKELEGEYRPGHFTGMLTIVLKFLNMVQPTRSYYGEKDYQQLLLIKKMVSALIMPVDIIGCSTQRAEDGLALSSRNSRLSSAQRQLASQLPQLLHSDLAVAEVASRLTDLGFKVDYIVEKWQRRLAAVWIDDIRLIDNIIIN